MANTKVYEILNKINEDFAKHLTESNPFELLGSLPINANTNKQYTKFNRLHLSMVLKNKGYKTSKFLTFRQINEKGGAVISDEKSYPVFFSSWSYEFTYMGKNFKVTAFGETEAIELANKKMETTLITKSHIKNKFCFTKFFYVFNLEQSDGIEYEEDNTTFAKANEIIKSQGYHVNETYGLPYVNDVTHELYLPYQDGMSDDEYYPEVFKALAMGNIADEDIEFHEKQMIAHIAAAFLSQTCGLNAPVISIADPSLVEKWLENLNESYYYLWRCSTKAQQIHDLLIEAVMETAKVA